jgi:hypothetical protein
MDVKSANSHGTQKCDQLVRHTFVHHQDHNIRQKVGRHAQLETARKKRSEKYFKAEAEKRKSIVASGPLPWHTRHERSQVLRAPSRSLSLPNSTPGDGDSVVENVREIYYAANEESNLLEWELFANSGETEEGSQALEGSSTREFTDISKEPWPKFPPDPQTLLGAGKADPFRTYPIGFSRSVIDALVAHCKCSSSLPI